MNIMLAMKHIHCENILEGKKKSELRLRVPCQPTPYRAYLYDCSSSGGSGMVVGECDVYDDVQWVMCVGIPSHLSKDACVTNDEIWRYSQKGRKDIHELRLRNVKRYDTPMKLSDFRRCIIPPLKDDCQECQFYNADEGCVGCGSYLPIKKPPQSW